MTDNTQDLGVIQALLKRFNEQRLPRAMQMKDKVDRGEVLEDSEVAYLADVFADMQQIKPLIARNPEYEELVIKGMSLYKDITEKALANAANNSN